MPDWFAALAEANQRPPTHWQIFSERLPSLGAWVMAAATAQGQMTLRLQKYYKSL
jgi:hypothetical protein